MSHDGSVTHFCFIGQQYIYIKKKSEDNGKRRKEKRCLRGAAAAILVRRVLTLAQSLGQETALSCTTVGWGKRTRLFRIQHVFAACAKRERANNNNNKKRMAQKAGI